MCDARGNASVEVVTSCRDLSDVPRVHPTSFETRDTESSWTWPIMAAEVDSCTRFIRGRLHYDTQRITPLSVQHRTWREESSSACGMPDRQIIHHVSEHAAFSRDETGTSKEVVPKSDLLPLSPCISSTLTPRRPPPPSVIIKDVPGFPSGDSAATEPQTPSSLFLSVIIFSPAVHPKIRRRTRPVKTKIADAEFSGSFTPLLALRM